MENSAQIDLKVEIETFLLLSHLDSEYNYKHDEKCPNYETLTDICDFVEEQHPFDNIVSSWNINYENLQEDMNTILNEVAPNKAEITYGRFWTIMTFTRYVWMKTVRNHVCMDYDNLRDMLSNCVDQYLSEWVIENGGLTMICRNTSNKPAINFLCKFLDLLFNPSFNVIF